MVRHGSNLKQKLFGVSRWGRELGDLLQSLGGLGQILGLYLLIVL